MPKGISRSVLEPLFTATIAVLKATASLTALAPVFNHVPQGQTRPYLIVENFTAIPWRTMGEHGSECTLQLHAVSEAFGDQECARILDAAIGALSYSKPPLVDYLSPPVSTFNVVSYKREHETTFKEELVGGLIVRHHVVVMRILVAHTA